MMTATQTRIVDQEHQRVGDWMGDQGATHYREGATCIGLERDGQLVAGAMFEHYNGASICAHIAVSGRLTSEWLWFICHYPFVQLGCHVVIGLVPAINTKARAFDEHFGFQLKTILPDADPSGDLCVYLLEKQHCRFLNRRSYGR